MSGENVTASLCLDKLVDERRRFDFLVGMEGNDFGAFCEVHGLPATEHEYATPNEWRDAIDRILVGK